MILSDKDGLVELLDKIKEVIGPQEDPKVTPSELREKGIKRLLDLKSAFQKKAAIQGVLQSDQELKTKYYTEEFIKFFKAKPAIDEADKAAKLFNDQATFIRAINSYIKKGASPFARYKLDAYSVVLRFEGYNEALSCDFNIQTKLERDQTPPNQPRIVKVFEELMNQEYYKYETVRELMVDIINSRELDYEFVKNRVEELSNPLNSNEQVGWIQRELIASALSISVFNHWDRNKVRLLKTLLKNKTEPMVFQRALVGSVLAMVSSYENRVQFKETIQILADLDETFSEGVFRVLFFFLKQSDNPPDGEVHHKSDLYIYGRTDRFFPHEPTFYKHNISDGDNLFWMNSFRKSFKEYLEHIQGLRLDVGEPSLIAMFQSDVEKTRDLHILKTRFDRKVNGQKKMIDPWVIDQKISTAYYELMSEFVITSFGSRGTNNRISLSCDLDRISEDFLKEIYHSFPLNDYIRILDLDTILAHPRFMGDAKALKAQGKFLKELTEGNDQDFLDAITCYKKALEFNKEDKQAFNGIGYSFIRRAELSGDSDLYRQAIEWFDLVLQQYTENNGYSTYNEEFLALCGKALSLIQTALKGQKLHEIKDAIELLREALKIQDFNLFVMYELGNCWLQMAKMANYSSHVDHALAWYDKALEFEENDSYAIHRKGLCYATKGTIENDSSHYHIASGYFQKAYKIHRIDPERLMEMGDHWVLMGKADDTSMAGVLYENALGWYQKAIELNPNGQTLKNKIQACETLLKKSDDI